MASAICFNLDHSKILSSSHGLKATELAWLLNIAATIMPLYSFAFCSCWSYCIPCGEQNQQLIKSLPKDKILDWSKLKAFADNKIELAKMVLFVFDRTENIVGKGENVVDRHFLHFPQCF